MGESMVPVIFDLDGTLLDTESVYLEVENKLIAAHGKGDVREITGQLLGTTEQRTAELVIEEYLKERNALLLANVHKAGLLPGADKLVKHLAAHGIPIAIATSSTRPLLEAKRKAHHEFFSQFPVVVCSDDVTRGKPDPEIFLAAAQQLSIDPKTAVVFEDAPAGVQGAIAAGMGCIAIQNEHTPAERYDGVAQLLNSLEEFNPSNFSLPPYDL